MIEKLKASSRPVFFWVGLGLIILFLIAACVWVFWPQKAVLFSGLTADDAARITAQLDKQKIPYQLSPDGSSIFMEEALVPKARLQVFSSDLNLKSGVGLELFSSNDLGMTEFSQHVNYVRALQGELTRTLLAIDGVQTARVHIAMPEGGSRRSQTIPTRVAVTLGSAQPLDAATVRGVQRLATAAVPGVNLGDVVIVDGKGALLTAATSATPSAEEPALGARLEQKAAIEAYMEKKALKLLQAIVLPPARAEVIVDVTLSERQRSVTREELIPSGQFRGVSVGLLQKGHFVRQPQAAAVSVAKDKSDAEVIQAAPEPQVDDLYEFANGRQVERVENPIGAVEKLSLSVVVSGPMPPGAEAALQKSLSRALGLDVRRGDEISVLLMPSLALAAVKPAEAPPPLDVRETAGVSSDVTPSSQVPPPRFSWLPVIGATLAAASATAVGSWLWARRRRSDPQQLAEQLRQMLQGQTPEA